MESSLAIIRARSRRQAMDWSLVLASQEIEVALEHLPEQGGWMLVVQAQDYERAWGAIRQYRLENRHWAWRQQLRWSGLTFHWGALLWCWLVILLFWAMEAAGPAVEQAGVVDSLRTRQGEWWRLFTAISLHADVGHLAANVSTGFIILGLVMARHGAGCGLLGAFLAGAGGNLFALLWRKDHYLGLGASGMVMGGLGLLAVQAWPLLRRSPLAFRQLFSGAAGAGLLFILMGLNPASDVLAHAGGFASGMVLGVLWGLIPNPLAERTRTNWIAGLLGLGLFFITWGLALRSLGPPRAP